MKTNPEVERIIENRKRFVQLLRTTKLKQIRDNYMERTDEGVAVCAVGLYYFAQNLSPYNDEDRFYRDLGLPNDAVSTIFNWNDKKHHRFPTIARKFEEKKWPIMIRKEEDVEA